MKKLAIAMFLSLALIATACSNDKEQESEKVDKSTQVETSVSNEEKSAEGKSIAEEASEQDSLNVPFDKIFGDPSILKGHVKGEKEDLDYSKIISEPATTVYFDKEDPSEEELGNYVMVYPIGTEDGTSLYLIFENSKLKEAKLDEFVGTISKDLFEADYMFYNFESSLESQPKQGDYKYNYDDLESIQKDLEEKYLDKEIIEFNTEFEVYSPISKIINLNNNKEVETYYLVNPDGYTLSTSVSVVILDGKILKIHVDAVGNRTFDIQSLAK